MQVEIEIGFEGMDRSEAVEARVRREAAKLEHLHDRITACRIVVSKPHRHKHKGEAYDVRIHMALPGGKHIDIDRKPGDRDAHEDVYVAVRDAFAAARRQLQDTAAKQAGKVKAHEAPPHGRIAAMFDDHGFIEASDGRQIYFEAGSVHGDGFPSLKLGQEVRFAEQRGAEGPRATAVHPVGKHHVQ